MKLGGPPCARPRAEPLKTERAITPPRNDYYDPRNRHHDDPGIDIPIISERPSRSFWNVSVRCSHVPFVAVATAFFECLALTGSKGGKRWHGDGRKKSRRSFGNAAGVRRRLDEWFRPLRQRGGLCRASPGSMGFSPHGSGGG